MLASEKYKVYNISLLMFWLLAQLLIAIFYREYGNLEYTNYTLFIGLCLPLPLLLVYLYDNKLILSQVLAPLNDRLLLLMFLSWLPGSILGVDVIRSFIYILLMVLSFVISSIYVSIFNEKEIRFALGSFAIISLVFLFAQALTSGVFFQVFRASGFEVLGANSIAFFAMTCASLAFCWKNNILRYFVLLLGLIIIYATNSRSCILGIFVTVVTYMVLTSINKRTIFRNLLLVLVIVTILFIVWSKFYDTVNLLMYFDDPTRGLQSGFSGRVARWGEAIDIIRDNYAYGVGFKCSNKYFGFVLDNGYLMYIVENGIFSGLITLILFSRALCNSFKNQPTYMDIVFVSVTIGYLVHSVFENFIFSVGNSGSLLFIFWIVYSNRNRKYNCNSVK